MGLCNRAPPGSDVTYTHNWPPDKQIGNTPTSDLILWTGFSIIMLLLGIGIMIFMQARTRREETLKPLNDPLMNQVITPSMWAVKKIFLGGESYYSHAGTAGSAYSPLRCRGWRLLRYQYYRNSTLFNHPHVAYSACYLLDSYGMACNRTIYCTFAEWKRPPNFRKPGGLTFFLVHCS